MLGRRLLEVIAPDQADAHEAGVLEAEERRARDCCTLVMHRRGDGITKGTFLLPDAQAAMLRQALEAICSPRRWALGDSTPPTAVCTGFASPPGVDDNAPVLEELNSTSGPDIADATATPGGAGLDPAGFRCTDAQPTSPAAGEAVARAATKRTGRSGTTDEMQTAWARLSHPQRMGLALATLVEHVPSDALPQTGATVTVALDYKHLVTGLGAATLSTGEKLSASQARRLACTAGLLPMVLNGRSLPLDLGGSSRLFQPSSTHCPGGP